MTDAELDRLEQLAAEATPGPWQWRECSPYGDPGWFAIESSHGLPVVNGSYMGAFSNSANGRLFAAAREAVPTLIAEVRRLRKELQAYQLAELTQLGQELESHWIERSFPNLGYHVRARLGMQNDCYVDVEAYELMNRDPGAPLFIDENCQPVDKLEDAQRFLSGSIKWDGCCNLHFDDSFHVCDPSDALNIGIMIRRLYTIAYELMPKASWEESDEKA